MNSKAPIAITRFMKNECITIFSMKTMNARNMTGEEQYIISVNVCKIGLSLNTYVHFGSQ